MPLRDRLPEWADTYTELLEAGGGHATCLQEAAEARQTLQGEGWTDCPTWRAVLEGQGAPAAGETSAGERPHGWQCHATRIQTKFYRDRVLMPALSPSTQALLRSQAGPQAGMWLTAIPAEAATTLPPQAMLVALRRRLRLALPLCPNRCGPNPGCGGTVDAFGDHALACPRTGLLARRAKVVECAWVRVAREAVGPEGQVVPQQWLAHTTAPGVQPPDRRRLDLVVYGATTRGGALCCDATLVSPLKDGSPSALRRPSRWGRPAGCRASQAGSLPRAHARRPANTAGAGVRDRRSLEHRG